MQHEPADRHVGSGVCVLRVPGEPRAPSSPSWGGGGGGLARVFTYLRTSIAYEQQVPRPRVRGVWAAG